MNKHFQTFAAFYDAFYQEKDYVAEVAYFNKIIQDCCVNPPINLLDIGCGTGKHAQIFAENGWSVLGIDTSAEMIAQAKKQIKPNLQFREGNFREMAYQNQFEVITSLFAVVSYMTDDDELQDFFRAIEQALKPQGIFIFDVWFADAVHFLKPENRKKTVAMGDKTVIRTAQSTWLKGLNLIEVDYLFEVSVNQQSSYFQEKHRLRYFNEAEITEFAEKVGLKFLRAEGFMQHGKTPTKNDWNVSFVLQKS